MARTTGTVETDPFVRRLNACARIVISGAILFTALYVLLSEQYSADNTKWATGAIGLVLGYWLK